MTTLETIRTADLFAGFGGASKGITAATGELPVLAVNHDPIAIKTYRENHPGTETMTADVFEVSPHETIGDMPLDILWASPDCTHFSNAKAGKPKSKNIRALAWVIVKWAEAVRPTIIFAENVHEFRGWGPLDDDGMPIKDRKGETFKIWVKRLEQLGYHVEHRVLNAADFGAPTKRKRLFIIARRDGQPINWPKPTHCPPDKCAETGLKPWVAAWTIIDWTLPCPSIFLTAEEGKKLGVRRPLAEKTMWRIANGIRRYCIEAEQPFIIRTGHYSPKSGQGGSFRGQSLNDPLATVCGTNDKAVVDPLVMSIDHQSSPKGIGPVVEPLSTVTGKARHAVVVPRLANPFIVGAGGTSGSAKPKPLDAPLNTCMAQDRRALVCAFLAKHFGGVTGTDLFEPTSTITARDHHGLVAGSLIKLRGTSKDGQKMTEPMPTVTGGGFHIGEVRAFLTAFYGSEKDGQSLFDPARTVTAKERLALGIVYVGDEPYQIIDIGMRMLKPHELLRAQFGPFADDMNLDVVKLINGKEKPLSDSDKVRLIGNSVPPQVAEAIVRANPVEAGYGTEEILRFA